MIGFWYTLKKLDYLEEILKDISTQALDTKYILILSQLLKVIFDIKHYIFNLLPSKFVSPEPIVD